jgi:hypothetical protein
MLKKSCLFVMACFSVALAVMGQPLRQKLNFNSDWKFRLGDQPGAALTTYNDSGWNAVGLPHSFSMPYFMSSDFYIGYGWYRKHFNVPYQGRRSFLEFEGVFQEAEIFVNGRKVGNHQGGYTGFSLDITGAVQPGDNIIAVRVNNTWNPRLAPRAGEHVFSGGIYRDVYLVVTDQVHVAWYGTFVSTPKATATAAVVNIKTEIKNDVANACAIHLKTKLFDPNGKLVATLSSQKIIEAGVTGVIEQTSAQLMNPQRWDPEHPFLYRAVSIVTDGKRTCDTYETSFGIRSIEWTADKGFFLNGNHVYLKGANVHQDHAGWGDAVTNAGFFRDVRLVKEAGFNFIRGSHYPRDPSFTAACDQLGVLFWSENAFWGIGGFARTPEGYWNSSAYPTIASDRPEFDASVLQQLSEMIRIFRNHPSVITWSMSNEPFFTSPAAITPMRTLLKKAVELAHTLDATRPAAIGGAQRPLDESRIDQIGDIAGYNGDGASVPIFQRPGVASVVSEYGSTSADRPGKYEPGWGDLEKSKGEAVYDWRSGQAIWCAFDHGSIAGMRLGKMGIIDYFRIPKRAWYWYRNAYKNIPPPAWPEPGIPAKLRLEADKLTPVKTDGTDDVHLLVTVLDANNKPVSNTPPVELRIESGPGEFPTGTAIRFDAQTDIRIQDGQAAIECRSFYAGKTVIHATSPGLEPAVVQIRFEGPVAYVQGKTPAVKPRVYVKFTKKAKPGIAQLFGRDNPTFASSADALHPAGYAADGKAATWWQPLINDTKPSWTLDTEKRLSLSEITIHFPSEAVYRYKVEVSENRQSWKLAGDHMQNQVKELSRKWHVPDGTIGSAVRIVFENAGEARISEVEVTGVVVE